MRPPLSTVPLLLPVTGFAAGILSGVLVPTPLLPVATLILTVIFIIRRLPPGWILSGFATAGAVCWSLSLPTGRFPDKLPYGSSLAGEVTDIRLLQRGNILTLELESAILKNGTVINLNGAKVEAFINNFHSSVLPGDRVIIRNWNRMENRLTVLPGDYDNSGIKRRSGISATIFIPPDKISRTDGGSPMKRWFFQQREKLVDNILKSGLNSETSHFLIAVLAGDTSFIGENTRNLFVSSGMAHTLALSGTHIAIISFFFSIILFPVKKTGLRMVYLTLLLAFLWFYALLTGLSYPVTRSVVMATAVSLAVMTGHRNQSFNFLLLSALIILVFSPSALFSLSFYLTFCSICSILLILPAIRTVREKSVAGHRLLCFLMIPIAAMLGCGPIIALEMNIFTPYFLLLAYPGQIMVMLIMSGGLIVTVLSYFNIYTDSGCGILDWMYRILERMMSFVESMDNSIIRVEEFPVASALLLLSVPFIIAGWGKYRRKVWLYCLTGVISGAIFISATTESIPVPEKSSHIICENRTTYIALKDKSTLSILNTDNEANRREMNIHKFTISHRGFIERNGITEIKTPSGWSGKVFRNGKCCFFLTDSLVPYGEKFRIDTLIVCRGFTGNITETISRLSPSVVRLSPDLDIRRRKRYLKELNKQPPLSRAAVDA